MTAAPPPHIPVLLSEVIESLAPRDGETLIDGTFGAGGYTRAILEAAIHPRDRHSIAIRPRLRPGLPSSMAFAPRLTLLPRPFR